MIKYGLRKNSCRIKMKKNAPNKRYLYEMNAIFHDEKFSEKLITQFQIFILFFLKKGKEFFLFKATLLIICK